ncbi:acyl-CoA thioesterase [Arthrobacter sp. Leaf141]|uniref:acyl-CoA thioesterase n=1 Tax=Arthrobacter sp. Leaf141 TaxID=1736273 RepID=UPI001F3D6BE0|nr:thioesterase family protein [Arthrobacter sp. Leaf141]
MIEQARADEQADVGPYASVQSTVEWVDTDASGHQHNSAVVRWVEAAEASLVRQLGLSDYFPVAPRVKQVLNFHAKLWFGQQITTTVWIKELGRSSLTLGFEVDGGSCDQSPGGRAASGTVTSVHVPAGAEHSAPWPDRMRQALSKTSQ